MMQTIKYACHSVLARLGYEIQPIRETDADFAAVSTVADSNYYTQWSAPSPLFSPWLGHPDFQAIYEGAAAYTLVPPERCYLLISFARYATHLQGHFAECGVYNGGTALLLARILDGNKRKLYLFDSFKGLPKVNQEKDQWFDEGEFSASVESVRQLLNPFTSFIDIREGWIPETFAGLDSNKYAFVHLDVDLYQSTLDCCKYFYPRLVPGGVLLFDEYGFASARGEKDAVDEFFAGKLESPIALPTGQAFVVKLPDNLEYLAFGANEREL
jgi:O-methyltransferase